MRSSPETNSPVTPYQNEYDNILLNYHIIDVGTILTVSEDGQSATVQGFNVQAGLVKTYKNVEVLYPAGVTSGIIGCPCIIFRPATGVQSVKMNTLLGSSVLHPEAATKAIPLFFNDSNNVKLGFVNGNYVINTENYSLSFGEMGVDIVLGNSAYISGDSDSLNISIYSYSININEQGIIETLYKDNEDNLTARSVYNPVDGSTVWYYGATDNPSEEEIDDLDSFTKWSWAKRIARDGTVSIQQLDKDEKILNGISVSSDGILQITTGENIVFDIDQDGNVQITNNKGTISLDKDGNLTFDVKGNIVINSEGDTNVKVSGDATVKGTNINVEASSKVVVKGTNVELNGMTKATGTSFECGGTVAPTGNGALCGLPACLFTGAPHAGNIATGV